ncbi:MAG: response regulator, partial [bacterium]|nr:response regulator [bacterium]
MSKRVLIVDDAVVMRMMIKGILSKNGFEVVGEAQNGVEAVEKY